MVLFLNINILISFCWKISQYQILVAFVFHISILILFGRYLSRCLDDYCCILNLWFLELSQRSHILELLFNHIKMQWNIVFIESVKIDLLKHSNYYLTAYMKIFDWIKFVGADNYTIILNNFTMWLTGPFKIFLHQNSLDSKRNNLMKHSWLKIFKLNWIYITKFVLFKFIESKQFNICRFGRFQKGSMRQYSLTAFVKSQSWLN